MTQFDDPNRQAVGLDPIWTEAENPPLPDGETFDPGDHTVAEVDEYLAANPSERDRVLAAEADGKARTTLLGGDET